MSGESGVSLKRDSRRVRVTRDAAEAFIGAESPGLIAAIRPASPSPSAPLRILEVLEATIGGTKRHLLDLLGGFVKRPDLVVEVAAPAVRDEHHGDTSFVTDARALGVQVHVISMCRRVHPARDAATLAGLVALIRRGRYDVVHVHSSKAGAVGRLAVLLASPASSERRPRLVYTPNGWAFLTPESRLRARLYELVERALGRVTDRLIATSLDERDEALRRGIAAPDRTRLIRNGITLSTLPGSEVGDEKRMALGWGPRGHTVVVGTVARMTAQKDPVTWVRAAVRAVEERDDLRFVWIMGGELEAEVRATVKALGHERDPRLAFLGYRADARELIAAMDVFTLSSVFEGLPYVLMEAMALGRPVVATAAIGSRDLVRDGETAVTVAPGDAMGLAAGILRVAGDPALAERLARAGRDLVVELCTTERQIADTAKVYLELRDSRRDEGGGRSYRLSTRPS